jgi:hypothetical protein
MTRWVRVLAAAAIAAALSTVPAPGRAQDDYEIDFSALERSVETKPYSIGGFVELSPMLAARDREAAAYRLRALYPNDAKYYRRYDAALRLEGLYRAGIASFHGRAEGQARHEDSGWERSAVLMEAYLSLRPAPGLSIDAGKKSIKWGVGYAWNPIGFVQRPKDVEDPEEALVGYTVLAADWIRSFDGPLATLAVTPVILPAADNLNDDFGAGGRVNAAAKIYALIWNTDVDLAVFVGKSRSARFGMDVARNLRSNLAIHGEISLTTDAEVPSFDEAGALSVEKSNAVAALAGVRWLTSSEITFIAEYYHDGGGIRADDLERYYMLVDCAYDAFVESGECAPLVEARRIAGTVLGRPHPGRDYVYLRASWKEPFDILYFVPAAVSIVNLADGSASFMPELSYSPVTNLDVRVQGVITTGGDNTDFGERLNEWRIELRGRYFF